MKKKYKKSYSSPEFLFTKKIARILLFGSFFSFVLAIFLTGYPTVAFILHTMAPSTSFQLSKVLSKPIGITANEPSKNDEEKPGLIEKIDEYQLPEKDLSLPEFSSVTIKKIGVETKIIEQPQEKYEEALKQGVWRVPNFGTPLERTNPIILVAHRFGYVSWSQEFREKNSFYDLPKLEIGDQIEIIWDQRKFVYEVYQKEEGENISHYGADLILYTCRFWNSDIRIFIYAQLI